MPRRSDIHTVLVVGSGPIVIGQACEFDYSGSQAIKALKEEGLRVVLLNSNPASVMTDPGLADRTYLEPIDVEHAEAIIAREQPDALLPTMGGQTALNLARALAEAGVLSRHGVQLIGASLDAIQKAEDRLLFKQAMSRIGLATPRSEYVRSLAEARAAAERIGFPAVVRPSFTLGGTGGGIARDRVEYERICTEGLRASPVGALLIEESVLGWKEFELEVVRDRKDNAIVVCSIENLDPMGVHTGDSITVAPIQTLTDKEYQRMRNAALAVMREINVETGGSNVQFAVDPRNGRMVVIEMNPRVSRSSALASKATGYPIARVATKLAIGYTLDELRNDITQTTPASFEPTLDYVVVKVPKFNFEKFPGASTTLGVSMQSVGEVMAIGSSFEEALFKALRSMETDGALLAKVPTATRDQLEASLGVPSPERIVNVIAALQSGVSVDSVCARSRYDAWFVERIASVVHEFARSEPRLDRLKALGVSDRDLAVLTGRGEDDLRRERTARSRRPVYKRVDTCAAEFESTTPFLYSTWVHEDEVPGHGAQDRVLILGSGPIRIGQGIEFDYCCVHAAYALKELGYEAVMVNCNPETVSTDPDTSSRLYFEPLTVEDVVAIAERERPIGAIVQLGGQTPLSIASRLERAGVPILGTPPAAIDRAEDRELFSRLIDELGLRQPDNGTARTVKEAVKVAEQIGYPVMVRPSYVLGGRSMQVIGSREELEEYLQRTQVLVDARGLLVDRFLVDAIEIDLDLVCDRTGAILIGGVMEHVQQAGVHSGDAACSLPPHTLSNFMIEQLEAQAIAIARELGVVGLMNVQFAIQGAQIFVLEVNPRASRTVPFVTKATGRPLAKLAAMCMVGKTLAEVWKGDPGESRVVAAKEAVFPFSRFQGVDVLLGPEMKSTGEVMGVGDDFATAFAKAQLAAGVRLPKRGQVFVSVRDDDKQPSVELAHQLTQLGFTLCATKGTARYLESAGMTVATINRVSEGSPHVVEWLREGRIALVINSSQGRQPTVDGFKIRREALMLSVPYYTTIQTARRAVEGIRALARGGCEVTALQDFFVTRGRGVNADLPAESIGSGRRRLVPALVALLLTVVGANLCATVALREPAAAEPAHRKPDVVIAPKDPRTLPPVAPGRSLWLIGNSHTYALPGLVEGQALREDPGNTLIDELEARVTSAHPSNAPVAFVRVANPNLVPSEMLVRAGYLLFHGRRPDVVVLGLTWRNVARESGLRFDIGRVLGEPDYAQWLGERLASPEIRADSALLEALVAERHKAEHAAAEDAARSDADRLDEQLTTWASKRVTLIGGSADLRARLYRAVAYRVQAAAGARASEHVDPVIPQDLAINTAALEALVKLLDREHVRLMVYLAPERSDLPPIVDRTSEQAFDEKVHAMLTAHGGALVDARDAVPNTFWGWEHDTPDRSHFTEPGHQRLAQRLLEAGEAAKLFEVLESP